MKEKIEILEAMGFEHSFEKYIANIDGQDKLCTYHLLTHPDVPGLMLGHPTLEGAVKHAIPVIATLIMFNELKVRNIKKKESK